MVRKRELWRVGMLRLIGAFVAGLILGFGAAYLGPFMAAFSAAVLIPMLVYYVRGGHVAAAGLMLLGSGTAIVALVGRPLVANVAFGETQAMTPITAVAAVIGVVLIGIGAAVAGGAALLRHRAGNDP
jgi:hypothetical protein